MSGRLEAWVREHPLRVDVAFAGLLLLGLVAPWLLVGFHGSFWWSLALVAPLAWRRRRVTAATLAVYGVAGVQWVAIAAGPVTLLPADLAVPFAAYAASAYGTRGLRRFALVGGLAGSVLAALDQGQQPIRDTGQIVVGIVLFGLSVLSAWMLGALTRSRQAQLSALRERALLLESERDQQARLAVAAERARIAREMHDVVAHSLAVMIAQADGGRYAATTSPQAAQEALTTISRTGREALAQMRRLLGVLRDGDPSAPRAPGSQVAGDGGPALQPQATLADLPELISRVRASGVEVGSRQLGTPLDLPPGMQLAAYRVVQEALTNVLKHAGPAVRAEVVLDWTSPGHLRIEVSDDGRGAAADGGPGTGSPGTGGPGTGGQGLRGMTERVALFGGTLAAGPRPGGGFAVRATIGTEERT